MDNLIEIFEASFKDNWLPEEMLEKYSPVECLAENDQCTTLLLQSRSGEGKSVAKCYTRDNVQVSVAEDDILSSISHDGLPDYMGKFENDETVCVVRRYIEGRSFDSVIKGKKFTPEETASFALKVCDILDYLHSRPQPVLHRDIKPENIVMDEDGNVYLIDFGISRMLRDKEKKDTKIAATASYAPPEQFGFLPTDARSDIYALGVVLNEMLTGSTDLNKKTSGRGMDKIVSKCTAFSPDDRYRSAEQLRKDIRRWKQRRMRAVLAVVLCAVLVVLAVPLAGFLSGLLFSDGKDAIEPAAKKPEYIFEPESGTLTFSGVGDISADMWISDSDFKTYRVTELVIEEGICGVDRTIGEAFVNLKSLTLSASAMEDIDYNTFGSANRLETITVEADDVSGVGWTYDYREQTLELFFSGIGTGVMNGENSWHRLSCIDIGRIRHVKVGEGVTGLGFNMLWDHGAMESLELPGSLVKLDSSNFADTPSLVSVTVSSENKYFRSKDGVLYWSEDSSAGNSFEKICFVPRSRTGVFTIPEGTKRLSSFSMAGCTGITEVVFPESLSTVEPSVFVNMTGLTAIKLPENSCYMMDAENGVLYTEGIRVQEDGSTTTFMDIIVGLPYISGHYSIPVYYDQVEILNNAFFGCKNLTEITIPENVLRIGDGAFVGCTSLETVNLPADVSALSEYARAHYLGYEAFVRAGVKSVKVPYGVTCIPEYCFYRCSGLTEIYIPDSVNAIEDSAFEGCDALRTICHTDRSGAVVQSHSSADTSD